MQNINKKPNKKGGEILKKCRLISLILSVTMMFGCGFPVSAESSGLDPFMKGKLESRQTKDVPWKNDSDFIRAKKENCCCVLMAAYKTVLHDPLPGEEENVHLAARYICGRVLKPGDVFSQNRTAGPYTKERGYKSGPTYGGSGNISETTGGGVCKIASTLFNTAILSNLKIVERHTHSMPVPYVPYGQDATVYYGAKDFRFMNSTGCNMLIWARGVGNILYIGFYGAKAPPKIVWGHDVIKVVKAPVIEQKNANLPDNTVITHEGMDGAVIDSWITVTYSDGRKQIKKFGRTNYSPLPYIKEISG